MAIENGVLKPTGVIQLRGGTALALSTENPLLARREIVVEVDTGKIKIGNGTDSWNALPYVGGGSGEFTATELRRLGILLEALFPTDTDQIYIPYINDSDPENPILLPFTPFQNLPKGSPPEWVQRDLPSGFTAYSGVHKMWYGSYSWLAKTGNITAAQYYDNALLILMLKGSSKSTVSMSSLTNSSETNYIFEPAASDGNYLDFLTEPHTQSLYYTAKEGVICTLSGGSSSTLSNHTVLTSSVLSDCNSLCYSEYLDIMLAVGETGNVVVMTYNSSKKQFTGSVSTQYTTGLSNVNPSSAAWSPDQMVFCIAGSEGTATSADGVLWNTHTESSVPKNLIDLSFREDLECFFARSLNDKCFYVSGDGETWQKLTNTPIPLETVACVDYSPATGIYCAVGGTGKNAYFSKDLDTWVSTNITYGADVEAGSVIYMPSTKRYVLMPTSGSYLYTFDPSEWIADNAETHNGHPSSNDLGTFNSDITTEIQAGTFRGIYPGDYLTFTNVAYSYLDETDNEVEDTYTGTMRVMHLDYHSNLTHHIAVVPDNYLFTAKMNDSSTTAGGYVGSKMRTVHLRRAEAIFKAYFGADHVLSYREYLVNAVTGNVPTGVEECNCCVELMDERMVFGSYRNDSGVHNRRVEPELLIYPHKQFAAFRHNHNLLKDSTTYCWLRNVCSSSSFCHVNSDGGASTHGAANSYGVRPVAFIC